MANINRDYLIVLDAKSSVISEADELKYYITDEHSQNLFVNLVVRDIERINKYVEVHDPEKYELELHIVKPNNDIVRPHLQANLLSAQDAIYAFELPKEATDYIGTYKCELRVTYQETDETTITTSNKFKYKIKRSIYNDLDSIQDAPQYPVVIQLFDKLSDINQYEEDRRANELARQLAEQQRQTRFDALDADMVDSIQQMDDKVVEVENRITTKEQAVDKLITDTKADIDNYKVAKDQEIDEYKTAKNDEINEAITNQDIKIDTAISEQNDRIALVENNDATQNNRLDTLENRATQHESRLTDVEAKNTEQDGRLDIVENKNQQQDNRLDVVEGKNVEQDNRLTTIEAIDVSQNTRLDAIEAKNTEQDDRLLDIEKVNKRQDMNLKCLFAESKNNMIDITEEGNNIYLQNSTTGYTLIDEIKGNTLVNCNKEPNKELILNGNINTSGDNAVTLTEGVDGGLVDVALEGNTLVNVSKTKDTTAITKAYTVENSGNHIALQGNIDGSCRPVITGNTLWIDNDTEEVLIAFDETKSLRLQSTFEDNLVTQEMVDSGEEVAENLGKYRVEYKITGKNLFDGKVEVGSLSDTGINTTNTQYRRSVNYIPVTPNTRYIFSVCNEMGNGRLFIYDKNKNFISTHLTNSYVLTPSEGYYIRFRIDMAVYLSQHSIDENNITYQLEEGDTATSYEPYKESTKTLYLNSPLLEGDTIEEKDGGIYHIHRWNKAIFVGSDDENWTPIKTNTNTMAFGYKKSDIKKVSKLINNIFINANIYSGDLECIWCNDVQNIQIQINQSKLSTQDVVGFKQWLQQNSLTVVYQLAKPTYELIEQSNLIIPSYANGHLDFNTAVPVEKVDFLPFSEELTYLYANTQYTVQFISDKATTADITLGGTQLLAQNIVEGLNRITITTPSELVNNKLVISGVGANISEVVVTDTNREFGYFEGMKSVGEGKELQVISVNSDSSKLNTQTLTHEPLRGIRDAKDRYVLIDGKWYIERNCGEVTFNENIVLTIPENQQNEGFTRFFSNTNAPNKKSNSHVKCDKMITSDVDYFTGVDFECVGGFSYNIYLYLQFSGDNLTVQDIKNRLREEPVTMVYELETPVYEPLEYNPLEVYSEVTHITTNSTIPCNVTVKNHGYNCILKPSTTYTISSNLGLNTVTTSSVLIEDCLRFMDTDTSNVTTMKDVLVLEGDWTTKANLIPTNFSGIESAFEQEYDAEKGKYKVNVKVANEDKTKENNITFYINEPLRGVGDIKDRVFIKDNKVVVERNCGSITLDGSDDEDWYIQDVNYQSTLAGEKRIYLKQTGLAICDKMVVSPSSSNKRMSIFPIFEGGIDYIRFPNGVNIWSTKQKFREWLQQNPVKLIYPTSQVTYEEVEYDDVKLFIESFKNSTLSYNSNVPVTSTVHYSYSVPIVDTIAQTASISNEQDVMIIDLATQVAVMEMMLM